MERLLQRDHTLLGPAPRDPFADPDASIGLSRRRSGVDFDDVFGGPPRNPSAYDLRRSLGEVVNVFGGVGLEEVSQIRRPWASLGEKPVFGECLSPSSRRKDLGDDFFNDIFRGSDSACSTPMKMEREPLSSTSSSRVLSPVRSLPPRTEVFSATSSLPSQLRKIAKDQKNPLFASSPDHSHHRSESSDIDASTCIPSILNRAAVSQDDLRRPIYAPFQQNFMSCRFSNEQNLSPKNINSAKNDEDQFKDLNRSKVNRRIGQFHFSIYKWASKGVMLVVPSNSKEPGKNDGRLGGLPVPFLHGVDLPSSNKIMPTTFPSESEYQDKNLLSDLWRQTKSTMYSPEEPPPTQVIITSEPESVAEDHQVVSVNEEIPVYMQELQKPVTWNFDDLINDRHGREGKEDSKQTEEKEDLSSGTTPTKSADSPLKVKRQISRKNVVDQFNDVPVPLEEKMPPGRVKGKVKEFIKIFNQELSCKPVGVVESISRNAKVRDFGKGKAEVQFTTLASKGNMEEDICRSNIGAQPDFPDTMDQISREEKLCSDRDSDAHKNPECSQEREEDTVLCFESTLENSDIPFVIVEDPHYEVEEFTVEHIHEEQIKPQQSVLDSEEIQNSDAKIRSWSAGKDGNIRSLLSTLQYVLWAGSGWKPVPLVDIIEGSSVKRAYQKALLCLHPDKLQQRGAPTHHKYMAEKVFDILQEAWDHFNTTSTM